MFFDLFDMFFDASSCVAQFIKIQTCLMFLVEPDKNGEMGKLSFFLGNTEKCKCHAERYNNKKNERNLWNMSR